MLRFVVSSLFLIACSSDQPKPVAPSGKAASVQDAPPAPQSLRVEALTDTSARVAWDAVEGATDYDINFKPIGGKWTNWPHRAATLYSTIYGLSPNSTYRWAVRAENRDGYSAWVFGDNFTTLSTASTTETETFTETETRIFTEPHIGQLEPFEYAETVSSGKSSEPFNITLRWEMDYPPYLVQAAEDAARKWETIITEGLQDSRVTRLELVRGWDYITSPIDELFVDDMVIVFRLGERTPRNLWGGAVSSYEGIVRSETLFTQDVWLPLIRFIYMPNNATVFEEPDNGYSKQSNTGIVQSIVLHEIGHCLGLTPPSNAERYPNMYAIWEAASPPQVKDYVPSEGSHWIEEHPALSQYGVRTNSTMMGASLTWWQQYLLGHVDTPYSPPDFDEGLGSITTLDAAALADLGYTVDVSAARPLLVVINDPKTVPQHQPRNYPNVGKASGKIAVPRWYHDH